MKFVLHYLEMLVAMVVGMVVVTLCGLPLERPDIAALVMATTMTIGDDGVDGDRDGDHPSTEPCGNCPCRRLASWP